MAGRCGGAGARAGGGRDGVREGARGAGARPRKEVDDNAAANATSRLAVPVVPVACVELELLPMVEKEEGKGEHLFIISSHEAKGLAADEQEDPDYR
uniref:Uncharacterized protein n=1 Tax=Oryza rufipogon TaxID=4529 RepID=A0A0E0PGZ3_ORYRU